MSLVSTVCVCAILMVKHAQVKTQKTKESLNLLIAYTRIELLSSLFLCSGKYFIFHFILSQIALFWRASDMAATRWRYTRHRQRQAARNKKIYTIIYETLEHNYFYVQLGKVKMIIKINITWNIYKYSRISIIFISFSGLSKQEFNIYRSFSIKIFGNRSLPEIMIAT